MLVGPASSLVQHKEEVVDILIVPEPARCNLIESITFQNGRALSERGHVPGHVRFEPVYAALRSRPPGLGDRVV